MKDFTGTFIPRIVSPLFSEILWRVNTAEKTLYLTFDDGPTMQGTEPIVRLLDTFRARATFFLLGRNAVEHPDLVQLLIDSGHTIGNHSFSHPDGWRTDRKTLERDLKQATDVLESQLGQPVHWMRPPYGRFNGCMSSWCRQHRQGIVMWDVLTWDFLSSMPASGIAERIVKLSRRGSVIVLHDNARTCHNTLQALEQALPELVDRGWQFEAL